MPTPQNTHGLLLSTSTTTTEYVLKYRCYRYCDHPEPGGHYVMEAIFTSLEELKRQAELINKCISATGPDDLCDELADRYFGGGGIFKEILGAFLRTSTTTRLDWDPPKPQPADDLP